MNDVMLDIETYSTKQGAVIATIGAVKFDPFTGELGDELHLHLSVESQLTAGAHIDDRTLSWWMRQSSKARAELATDKRLPLFPAMVRFKNYLANEDCRIWGNGSAFDVSIMQAAYERIGMPVPWKFWNVRCFRTLKTCFPVDVDPMDEEAKHHALDDAKHQARHLHKICKHYGLTFDYRQTTKAVAQS